MNRIEFRSAATFGMIVLIFVVGSVIGTSGCETRTVEVSAEQAKLNKEIEESPWQHIKHFKYKGHQYIRFSGGHSYPGAATVHDPDCPCGDLVQQR